MKFVRRGIDIEVNGLVARSLKAILPKLFKKDRSNIRYVNGFRSGFDTPLCSKRYHADINLSLDIWNGEEFERTAGFQYF